VIRLPAFVAAELVTPVDPRVTAFAQSLADRFGDAACAVLFYGSCLRSDQLEGLMLDFYVIVSDYESAYGKGWLARANSLLPPNVFPAQHGNLMAKYAVLSLKDFRRLNSIATRNVSVWARFAQPSRLVWYADGEARSHIVASISHAAPTLLAAALPLYTGTHEDPLDLWRFAFSLTYGAELRAERGDRAQSVVDADPDRYRQFHPFVLAVAKKQALTDQKLARQIWAKRRREGKMLTLARLAKASLTYAGGIEYLAWKINRHAGTQIQLKPWQKRWPLLGAVSLLPKLVLRGAVR
jgi:hypothetical protein